MIDSIPELAREVGIAPACEALAVPRATFYRRRRPEHGPRPRSKSPRALGAEERQVVLDVLHEERFVDMAPAEVYATLLDEGRFICSISTMYRLLRENSEVRERRDQARHIVYAAPELLAERPNQVWSWDITKLLGPQKWSYYHLYVILDIFSRYIVGWMVAPRESAILAEKLFATTCDRQGVESGSLTVHADRGTSMTSKTLAHLFADLGVTKTHSRPQVSNDNPYSESGFKTLKYRPGFPERFGCIEDARVHIAAFVEWYNRDHHHSGIALLTPHDLHYGLAQARVETRNAVLLAAHQSHPERFVTGPPTASPVPTAAWINPPAAPKTSRHEAIAAGAGAPHTETAQQGVPS